MSIKIMSRVWEQSKQGGSPLLLLLAVADNANDAGWCWPSQETLAKKIRMSPKSIPRIARKLQSAGELFINNRSDQGKVTRYIVTIGMSSEQFDCAVKNLRLNQSQSIKAKKWFAEIGKKEGGQDEAPPSCTPPKTMGRGVDIAMGRGVDIAMGTEPSLTVNEPSIMPPSGENDFPDLFPDQPPVNDKPQNGKPVLTEADKAHLQTFGVLPGQIKPDDKIYAIRQEFNTAGWQIHSLDVEMAIAHYVQAVRTHHPEFIIPQDMPTRKDWYKAAAGHLQNYSLDKLAVLYKQAIIKMRDSELSFWRPGSLTKWALPEVANSTGETAIKNHTYTPNLSDAKCRRLAELIAEDETK